MSTYEPGTVAVATVNGVPGVRLVRLASDAPDEWYVPVPSGDALMGYWSNRDVTDVRPLVVLDLDFAAHVGASVLVADLRAAGFYAIADQIEEQTRPPKPAEPTGRYAVVEDITAGEWCRIDEAGEFPWQLLGQPASQRQLYRGWDQINAVRVLSEGVS